MTSPVERLAYAIDLIARRCYRGVPALTGKAERPGSDALYDACLYCPSSDSISHGTGDLQWVASAACRVADLERDLALVTWDDLVEAVRWYSSDELTKRDWTIYMMHVRYGSIVISRLGEGGVLGSIADRYGIDVKTVRRIVSRVPESIARIALGAPQMSLLDVAE